MKGRINSKIFNVILILALVVLGFFNIKSCNKNKSLSDKIRTAVDYKDTVMFYKSKSDKLISYNKAIEISLENLKLANKNLKAELEDLKIKKPKTITKIKTEVEIKEILIPYNVELPCDTFNVPFSYKEDWFFVSGKSMLTGITIDSLNLVNDMLIVVGEKDNGLFKRNDYIVAVKSENPYFKITSIKNYTLKPKEPFYDKVWFKTSMFVTGFILGNRIK
jgi:hypothetical protein